MKKLLLVVSLALGIQSIFGYKIILYNDTDYKVTYTIEPASWGPSCAKVVKGTIAPHQSKVINGKDEFGEDNDFIKPGICCIKNIVVGLYRPGGYLIAQYKPALIQCRDLIKHIKIKNNELVIE